MSKVEFIATHAIDASNVVGSSILDYCKTPISCSVALAPSGNRFQAQELDSNTPLPT